MANRSLGTAQNKEKDGLDALTHRLIIQAIWPTPGVIQGLDVSGDGSSYYVQPGVAVVQKAETDGCRLAHFDGGSTDSVESGDASNPRIDSIYLTADDPIANDDSVDVRVGVVQGSPSASPVAPVIPDGSVLLAQFQVPAGATNPTTEATQTYHAILTVPYGGTLGKLGEFWWKQDMVGSPVVGKMFYEMPINFAVPTDRLVEFNFQVSYSSAGNNKTNSQWSVQFQLDGQDIPHAAANFEAWNAWETHQFSFVAPVSAGSHTARLRTWLQNGARPQFHYSSGTGGASALWIGRRFTLWDRGIEKNL